MCLNCVNKPLTHNLDADVLWSLRERVVKSEMPRNSLKSIYFQFFDISYNNFIALNYYEAKK